MNVYLLHARLADLSRSKVERRPRVAWARTMSISWVTPSSVAVEGFKILETSPSTLRLESLCLCLQLYSSRTRLLGSGTIFRRPSQSCLPTSFTCAFPRSCTPRSWTLGLSHAIFIRCRHRIRLMTLWRSAHRRMTGSWSSWQHLRWPQWMCR